MASPNLDDQFAQPRHERRHANSPAAEPVPVYFTPCELANRFRISMRTLERWRWKKTGPNYIKLGGKIVYALTDVETYERRRRAETHSSILGSSRGAP